MAIIVRIVSADGSKTVTKTLPALPSRIKVPQGAKVEVIDKETGVHKTLMQYINDNSREAGHDGKGSDGHSGVTVETVADWGEAISWLDAVEQQAIQAGQLSSEDARANASPWYDPGTDSDDGEVFGFEGNALLIGGLVGAAAIGGALALGGGGGRPKDTTPPAPPLSLDLAADDDLGIKNDDNFTSKSSALTISGTAEAGAKVELFSGTTSLGTVTAGADGKFTMDITLAEGVHQIRANATDLADNTSTFSTALQVTVDTTAPAAPTALALRAADDTNIPTDGVTNKNSVTVTGAAPTGAVVTLYDGETSIGTATADADGKFSVAVTLTEGAHNLTATIVDLAGNISAKSTVFPVVVDTTLPNAVTGFDLDASDDNGASSTDNVTSITDDLTFSGVADAGTTVRIFEGNNIVGTGVAGSNGLFSIDIDLGVGTHNLVARSVDLAGNSSPSTAVLTVQVIANSPAALALDHADTGHLIG
ncbi:MAG TPA: Ig-like domain-containing protein [Novosphingobium sp.]|nr:Ig-like domain-containing protein [Novosphingobium sp.]